MQTIFYLTIIKLIVGFICSNKKTFILFNIKKFFVLDVLKLSGMFQL